MAKKFNVTAEQFFTQAQEVEQEQEEAQEATHDVAQEVKRRTVRTQGRKGKKKPRINMAFEPDIYDYIVKQAEREDKSLTQFVNDIIYDKMEGRK